jgi:hypothetical protein
MLQGMIIIFTPRERPDTRPRPDSRDAHQSRFRPNRPLPGRTVEEEAVFTDPFGPADVSAR